jgi:hypothetical protein
MSEQTNPALLQIMQLYNNQRNAQVFLFTSLYASALHVSGFL